ncbi:hypothetical protein [Novosphingobium sp. SL115]|uniref:hypothetical protein n=1 Tax=Novosphingobium sp. SL115 TaxID=2995150 RepID=UPI003FA351DC
MKQDYRPTWRKPIGILALVLALGVYVLGVAALSGHDRRVARSGADRSLYRAGHDLAFAAAPLFNLDGNRALGLNAHRGMSRNPNT